MARKGMQLDAAMLSDMHAVGADSFKDKISMIHVEKIKPSLDNFYAIKDIEILAEDIERQGLKHNLVVTEDANNPDTYFIKSGHRRFEAIKLLIKMNLYTSNYVPCLVDGTKTKSENMLDLIMLNATTRVMTDAELYRQYEVLRETLDQLKEEGKKIKGRLRENVAAFLKISPAQVGKIENIKHNAEPEVQKAVENGELSIATANDIARLPDEQQRELIAENNLSEITSAGEKVVYRTALTSEQLHQLRASGVKLAYFHNKEDAALYNIAFAKSDEQIVKDQLNALDKKKMLG